MRKEYRSFLALLVSAAASLPASAPAAVPTIYNLGTLGGTESAGYAVNSSGQVAGYSRIAGLPLSDHAFRYSGTPGSGGVMADLGTLGGLHSWGNGINASGQVAGYSYTVPGGVDFTTHAFRYTGTPGSGGVMADLGTLGGTNSFSYALNASGQVAGASNTAGDAATHAFRYTGTPGSGGAMADLGTLGGKGSYGNAINDSSQVAGHSYLIGDAVNHAFRYTGTPGSGGAMADLGTLGGLNSTAYAINAGGQVTGIADVPSGYFHAFLYTGTPGSGGSMADLGTFSGTFAAFTNSYGWAVNAGGQVAGASEIPGGNVRAFLYIGTPGLSGRMINLDTWLDANNPTEGAKWTLEVARGLNDNGLITGVGTYNDGPGGLSDGSRAFLLNASKLLSPQWNINGGGSWGAAANWSPQLVPNSPTAIAFFFGAITADQTIYLDGDKTVNEMIFDNAKKYTIAPGSPGTLTVGNGTSGTIEVAQGIHEISADFRFSGSISKTGPGTLIISGVHNDDTWSSLTVKDGGLILNSNAGSPGTLDSGAVSGLALVVSNSGRVSLNADQDLFSLDINTAEAGPQRFDLASGFAAGAFRSIRIHGSDLDIAKASLWSALQNANAPGALDPTDGIYDSTQDFHSNSAIGLAQMNDAHGDPMIVMRLTRVGDLNLDGSVSISDFIDLSANFGGAGTWQEGDLNYDGMVTIADFIDLSANFGSSYAGDSLPISPQDRQLLSAYAASIGAGSIPEPGILLISASLASLALRRRELHSLRLCLKTNGLTMGRKGRECEASRRSSI